jgi:transcriptional regulator with XRE-family HTH domain
LSRQRDDLQTLQGRVSDALHQFPGPGGSKKIEAVAGAVGVTVSSIYNWMGGVSEPDLAKLSAFAAATDVSLAWLVTGKGPRNPRAADQLLSLENYSAPRFAEAPDKPGPIALHGRLMAELVLTGTPEDRMVAGGSPEGPVLLVEVREDAMEPTILKGDFLLVGRHVGLRRAEVAKKKSAGLSVWDGIYVFRPSGERDEGGLIVRRVHFSTDGATVISCDNRIYPEETYPPKAKTRPVAVGRVIWRAGRI